MQYNRCPSSEAIRIKRYFRAVYTLLHHSVFLRALPVEQPLFYGGKMYVLNIYCCCRIHHPERCGAGLRQKIDADLFNKPMELYGEIRILVAVNQRLNVRFSHNIYM